MAGRKTTGAARSGTRSRARAEATRSVRAMPTTLDELSRRVQQELSTLERRIVEAAAPARRELARALRQASHRLGRLEATGRGRWQRLTGDARRQAAALLRRVEKAVGAPARRRATKARRSRPRRAA
jgi:hypothetical protein